MATLGYIVRATLAVALIVSPQKKRYYTVICTDGTLDKNGNLIG